MDEPHEETQDSEKMALVEEMPTLTLVTGLDIIQGMDQAAQSQDIQLEEQQLFLQDVKPLTVGLQNGIPAITPSSTSSSSTALTSESVNALLSAFRRVETCLSTTQQQNAQNTPKSSPASQSNAMEDKAYANGVDVKKRQPSRSTKKESMREVILREKAELERQLDEMVHDGPLSDCSDQDGQTSRRPLEEDRHDDSDGMSASGGRAHDRGYNRRKRKKYSDADSDEDLEKRIRQMIKTRRRRSRESAHDYRGKKRTLSPSPQSRRHRYSDISVGSKGHDRYSHRSERSSMHSGSRKRSPSPCQKRTFKVSPKNRRNTSLRSRDQSDDEDYGSYDEGYRRNQKKRRSAQSYPKYDDNDNVSMPSQRRRKGRHGEDDEDENTPLSTGQHRKRKNNDNEGDDDSKNAHFNNLHRKKIKTEHDVDYDDNDDGDSSPSQQNETDSDANDDSDYVAPCTTRQSGVKNNDSSAKKPYRLKTFENDEWCQDLDGAEENKSTKGEPEDYKTMYETAVQWMDNLKTEMLASISKLSKEVTQLHSIVAEQAGKSNFVSFELSEDFNFPLHTVEEVAELEERLTDSTFRINMTSALASTGGDTVKQCLWLIMKRVFAPCLCVKYNYTGCKGKLCFKDLIVRHVIFQAIRRLYPKATDYDIYKILAVFLYTSKDRDGGRMRRRVKPTKKKKGTKMESDDSDSDSESE